MIRTAESKDLAALTRLGLQLWPGHAFGQLQAEFAALLADENALLALWTEGGEPVGFVQCQLRFDYVEGTQSSPVGYLEGVFVRPEWRQKGLARALVQYGEGWARRKGCTEFASDCELTNTGSLRFHLKLGFAEANRIICFHKKL